MSSVSDPGSWPQDRVYQTLGWMGLKLRRKTWAEEEIRKLPGIVAR